MTLQVPISDFMLALMYVLTQQTSAISLFRNSQNKKQVGLTVRTISKSKRQTTTTSLSDTDVMS
jgi:hypothetical protein